jgi:hypothetical protein
LAEEEEGQDQGQRNRASVRENEKGTRHGQVQKSAKEHQAGSFPSLHAGRLGQLDPAGQKQDETEEGSADFGRNVGSGDSRDAQQTLDETSEDQGGPVRSQGLKDFFLAR